MTERPPEYIGDGVYLADDGYQLWLAVGHHENRVVALDRDTWKALLHFGTVRWHRMASEGQ